MLKAKAWPYPIFEEVQVAMLEALFTGKPLEHKVTKKGVIIDGHRLRHLGAGTLTLKVQINTSVDQVSTYVFGDGDKPRILLGLRVLCESSKYRSWIQAESLKAQEILIPLDKVRGSVEIRPVFTTGEPGISSTGDKLATGAVVGQSKDPLVIAIDEDWSGEQIPIRWVDFTAETPPLPKDALIHVHFSGTGEVLPELWLNELFKDELGTIINYVGLNSPQGIAGHLIRQFLWLQFWQRIVPWAVKFESEEREEWPATRIASMWRTIFLKNNWEWPNRESIDLEQLEELSAQIQHHLKQGEAVAQVSRVWELQN